MADFNTLIESLSETINQQVEARVEESMAQVQHMLQYEDQGWNLLLGHSQSGSYEEGPDLDDVRAISEKARSRVALASLDKRAVDLHAGFIFGKGLDIEGSRREDGSRGAPTALVKFVEKKSTQSAFLSPSARKELQKARFTDGNVFVLCENKTAHRVPLSQIVGYRVDPEYPDEVQAWKRQWTVRTGKDTKTLTKWYYSNRFEGTKATSFKNDAGEPVPVAKNAVIVDLRANRQVGWALGVPDATAGMLWAEAYGKVLTYGQVVNESLSKIIYKVVNRTKKGAQDAGVKISQTEGFGNAASMAEGQDIQMVNTSMRSFDFSAARPLAAMAAAAWNVSNMDLLSDSSAAGSSYGSAQALTDGIRNAMLSMQEEWTEFFSDILDECGAGRPDIHWPPMDAPDPYRQAQTLVLLSPTLSDEEYREKALNQLDIPGDPKKIPETLKARSAAADATSAGVQQAAPDQGQNSDAGSAGSTSSNDLRSDTNTESLMSAMQMESFLERAESILRGLSEIENR